MTAQDGLAAQRLLSIRAAVLCGAALLAVCKKIVERHGGRIWVESEPGHRFNVSFHGRQATGAIRA